MVNSFEHHKIKTTDLPTAWKADGALMRLESFLQANWEQRAVFYDDGSVTSKQQYIDFNVKDGIKLQNYIGTIAFEGEQFNIFPKVFRYDEDDFNTADWHIDDMVKNLVVWLGYCDKLNFPFVTMKSELIGTNNLLELFVAIYVRYLKNILDREIFHRYEDIRETGSIIKGKIDIYDYMTKKACHGNLHQMDCTYSSFLLDNLLNRIIKCTCRQIMSLTTQATNKETLHKILIKLNDVSDVVCTPYDCDYVHLNALNRSYNIILSMSKMFLLNKVNSYNTGITQTFCFLFPVELLFEGFVGGFLQEMFKDRAKVTFQSSSHYLAELVVDNAFYGNVFLLKPDIVLETADSIFILDTKYKEIDRFEKIKENKKLDISDNDIKQMAVYGARRGAKKMYLIYPLHRSEDLETISIRYDIKLDDQLAGKGKFISLEVLKIPFIFDDDIEKTKSIIRNILSKIEI